MCVCVYTESVGTHGYLPNPAFSCCPHRYLTAIPRILADVYNSLGTQLPEALVAVLPSDFFSDESVEKDSVSPTPSSVSATQNPGSGDRLDELRSRSARKKRCVFICVCVVPPFVRV